MRLRPLASAMILALGGAVAFAASAQDEAPALGSGLTFQGAPTMQEILAQEKACQQRKPPRKGTGTISEPTYRRMERLMVAIGKGEYADSEQKLLEMHDNVNSGYEKAIIQQTLAYIYAMQNKHGKAIAAYERALETNALPQTIHEQMTLNVAQMHLAEGQMRKGEDVLKRYMAESCNPAPEAHIALGMIYADRKDFVESLKQTDLGLIKAKSPKESWLQLKLALHYELKQIARCAEVLVHLIAMSPMKETYFKQMHGVLTEIKRDNEALAVLALADRRGFMDEEREFVSLSNMYMFMDIPFKAAQVLDRGLAEKKVEATEKNLEKLANAWFAAREHEKAEAAMARAAQVSNSGEIWKQLGNIQMEQEKWKDALESFQKAQRKGNSKNPGEVQLLIGVAATQLKQWKTAEEALREAMQHEKFVKPATEWLNHMRAEYAYYNPANGNGTAGEAQQAN